ncbi:hypothetical protein DAEQUDRAFT_293000 [Daedalea quercina L-15889]|uniref:Uncharacterized protein n=1 Tax=Daedalea quercina L-15889 TaxID=1314783 RepID=A0A165TZE0_9APHY|nr:hypothetical protein DAEQUDRAFT_293000 [Daedalea quercina L-15889]
MIELLLAPTSVGSNTPGWMRREGETRTCYVSLGSYGQSMTPTGTWSLEKFRRTQIPIAGTKVQVVQHARSSQIRRRRITVHGTTRRRMYATTRIPIAL